MAPLSGKSKSKGREGRRSRSRNTTPSSNVSIPITTTNISTTGYLDIDVGKIMIPTNLSYNDILERHGGGGGIPEVKHLEQMADELKILSQLAETREQACNGGMRELVKRRIERVQEERQKEQDDRQREEKESLKRAAEEDEEARGRKGLKSKKQKKDRSTVREERPLAVGAHGLARQDGLDLPSKEPVSKLFNMPRRSDHHIGSDAGKPTAGARSTLRPASIPGSLDREIAALEALYGPLEPRRKRKTKIQNANEVKGTIEEAEPSISPPKSKVEAVSSSSLSETSQPPSPTTAPLTQEPDSQHATPSPSSSSLDSHQPPPAASVAQYQTFGPDPTTFDDPTIYHIRDVTPDMTDEEKKEIYSVAQFPHDDLSHLIAGTPPDKDFSNAKPTNQVNANTFLAYIEPYLRPLTEEDMAFLRERGDRVNPFVMPRRGKRHYTEVWAEEDGQISVEGSQQNVDKLPPNQGRGSLEQMTDEIAETDQISNGPMLNRLLSTMRFEHRQLPAEDKANGSTTGVTESSAATNGPFDLGEANGVAETINGDENKPSSATLPSATFMPESSNPNWKLPPGSRIDHTTMDERIKQELRHIGFIGPEAEPDYDGHFDDPVAERLRFLQNELRRVSIENGARKARVEELAKQRMAFQEYNTILEDLDGQVQQAYLKRSRTMGKNKKNAKRPGGPGGGSHPTSGGAGAGNAGDGGASGMAKPGIGDVARQLMNRRQRWEELISPIFDESITKTRGKDETIFDEESMQRLMAAEKERWDEDAE